MNLARRDQLVEEHEGVARWAASRMYERLGTKADYFDLVSDAMLGLVKAADGYDEDAGVKFLSYAMHRVNGEMLDGVRERRFTGRRGIIDENGDRMPDPTFVSLDAPVAKRHNGTEDVLLHEFVPDPLAEAEIEDVVTADWLNRLIGEMFARLPERERLVLTLRYLEGLTQAKVGEFMGVSESRISQIESKALSRCRAAA